MKLRHTLLSALAATVLTSCTTVPQTITANSLLEQSFKMRDAQSFDVAAFFEQMPEWMDVSFAESSFDSQSGAMVISDLFLSPKKIPQIGIRIDRADIWGGDPQMLESVMSGTALGELGQIFDRASFRGIKSVGLQAPDSGESVSMKIDVMVFDSLSAKSFSLSPVEGEPEFSGTIRTLAAIVGSYAFDGAAYSNLKLSAKDNGGSEVLLNVAQGFVRGYDRGATEYQRMEGFSMTSTSPNGNLVREIALRVEEKLKKQRPEDKILQPWMREELNKVLENPIAFIAYNSGAYIEKTEYDLVEVSNADVSGAVKWLANWQLPPITETNLLDFGAITVLGNRVSWNGVPVFSIARSEISASDFYWLIPSNYQQRDSGINVNLMELIDQSARRANFGVTPETGSQELLQAKQAITALGLEQISGEGGGRWNWNGETGSLKVGSSFNLIDLASSAGGLDLGGPSLIEWDQLVRSGAAQDVIQERISLGSLNFSITDDQLLDKVYALAATQMGGGGGDDLRQSLPAMVRLSSGQFGQMNQRIPGYLDAIANFLGGSGTLTVNMAPATPVNLKTLRAAIETEPQTLPDIVNLTIDHRP